MADRGRVMHLPRAMGFDAAAALPVALQTMHDAIVTNGGLRAGESVLIQGASFGVGLMGLQIAKTLGAGLVIGTSTRAELTLDHIASVEMAPGDVFVIETPGGGGYGLSSVVESKGS